MIKADKIHKERVIDILSECFDTNKTVNWIVKQDEKRKERIRCLIDYSFEACIDLGGIYLTDDLTGVVVWNMSHEKLPVLEEAYLTLQYVLKVTGIEGIGKAFKREQYINRYHPQDDEFIYLWFLGVTKTAQGKGVGSALLQEVINKSKEEKIPVYVETSNSETLAFYNKHGFEVYHVSEEEVFGYNLYFLRRFPDANYKGN